MPDQFVIGNQPYALNDDGDTITGPYGAMSFGMLDPSNPVRQQAEAIKAQREAVYTPQPATASALPPNAFQQSLTGMVAPSGAVPGNQLSRQTSIDLPPMSSEPPVQQSAVPQTPAALIKPMQQAQPQSISQPDSQPRAGQYVQPRQPQGPTGLAKYEDDVQKAMRAEAETQAQAQEGQAVTAALIGQVQADKGEFLAQKEQEQAEQFAQRQKDIAAENKKVEDAQKDYLNTKIKDPWASRSTGQTILQAIAIGMGQFGTMLAGRGTNTALDIINKAVERDIQIQEANLNRKGAVLSNARGSLAIARQNYADKESALNAAIIMGLKRADQDIAMFQQQDISQGKKDAGQMMRDKIEVEIAGRKEQLFAAQQAARERAAAASSANVAAEVKKAQEAQLLEKQMEYKAKTIGQVASEGKDGAEKIVRVGNKLYQAPTIKEAQEGRALSGSGQQAFDLLNDLDRYTQEGSNLSPNQRAEINLKAKMLMGILAKVEDPTAIIRESDIERFKGVVGDPTAIIALGRRGGYSGAKQYVAGKLKSFTAGYYQVLRPGERLDQPDTMQSAVPRGPIQ